MALKRHIQDGRPGSPPDIRFNSGGITFTIALPGLEQAGRLAIRCDQAGGVWVSIQPTSVPQSD
jgi:hypothetical protein